MSKNVASKLRKNDQVRVMSGKDRGKSGRVVTIDRVKGRAVIEGLNLVKKAMKAKGQQQKGGISSVEAAIHLSNLQMVCKKCGPTRVGYKVEGERKLRICRKCGGEL
ncbi:MAG: 50S ribosomal protein L24 [Spirochaetes bacterium RBG_16_67_19]|jgi:large subunit ribosomal protein L24|nr:MAG: 50S ribosomal protein L24 [Spirochaetes bacterium RBG_16_67_19]